MQWVGAIWRVDASCQGGRGMTSVHEVVFCGVGGRWCVFTRIRGGMSEAVFRSLDGACIKSVPLLGIHFAQVKM